MLRSSRHPENESCGNSLIRKSPRYSVHCLTGRLVPEAVGGYGIHVTIDSIGRFRHGGSPSPRRRDLFQLLFGELSIVVCIFKTPIQFIDFQVLDWNDLGVIYENALALHEAMTKADTVPELCRNERKADSPLGRLGNRKILLDDLESFRAAGCKMIGDQLCSSSFIFHYEIEVDDNLTDEELCHFEKQRGKQRKRGFRMTSGFRHPILPAGS